jgi:hypothetical protein
MEAVLQKSRICSNVFRATVVNTVWHIVPSDKLIKKGDSRVQLRYVESSSSLRS